MEIRPVAPDEIPEMEALWRNAYRVDTPTAHAWAEATDPAHTRAAVGEGRVQSLIKILPFEVLVGGRPVRMGGIGGVATWADLQGRGLAGRLMAFSVPEMHRLGYAISILYPFAHRWYARYGWETAGRSWVYSGFRPSDLPSSREGVRVQAVRSEQDLEEVRRLYERVSPRYNGMVRRTDSDWRSVLAGIRDDRTQLYLIRGERDGETSGYFLAVDLKVEGGYETLLREYLCADAGAYRALFGFLSTLPTNVRSIRILAPEYPSLWNWFREPTVVTAVQPTFQCRVVDVEAACRARGWAENAAAEVTFAVRDEHGPWNSAVWRLKVEDGKAEIGKVEEASPEISLTINQFSALYLGHADPAEWVDLGLMDQSARPAAERLRGLFRDRPTSLLDLF